MSSRIPAAAEWTRRPERGSLPVVRFMARLSIAIGRGPSRLLLPFIALYFLATGGSAGRHTAAFLERVLGRRPTVWEQFGLFLKFSGTIHDRIYFLRDHFDLFDVDVKGAELFEGQGGAILMGGHVGSFEVLRACGRERGKHRVAMAMYEVNARLLHDVLAAINPEVERDIVALGSPQSMLEVAARLDAGTLVGFLADRTRGDEPTIEVPFLGAPAAFPTGPMRTAAALGRRVIFMAGLYRGGNRYQIRFETVADFAGADAMDRAGRDAAIREAIAAYAQCLERCVREAPDNWFNFHDFWGRAA